MKKGADLRRVADGEEPADVVLDGPEILHCELLELAARLLLASQLRAEPGDPATPSMVRRARVRRLVDGEKLLQAALFHPHPADLDGVVDLAAGVLEGAEVFDFWSHKGHTAPRLGEPPALRVDSWGSEWGRKLSGVSAAGGPPRPLADR